MEKLIRTFIVVALVWLGACAPVSASGGGPKSWVDRPLDGMQLPLAPYEIVAHAEDPAGIAQFEFKVNGNVIATTAGGEGSLSTVRQMWNPAAPGDYVISVRALSASGSWGGDAIVHVNIYGAQFKTPVPPTGTAPALPTHTLTPIPIPVFVLLKNANCRQGPSQALNETGAAYAGDSVPIEGRNKDGTWWLVKLPNGRLCWLSGAAGNATGNVGNVQFVQASPVPVQPTKAAAPPPIQPVQGCFVYDANQQPVCTVPCPENPQPGGACSP